MQRYVDSMCVKLCYFDQVPERSLPETVLYLLMLSIIMSFLFLSNEFLEPLNAQQRLSSVIWAFFEIHSKTWTYNRKYAILYTRVFP